MKSGGFAAHENLDAINMAIRKQTASSSRLPDWYLLRRVLSTVEFTGARGLLKLLTPLGKLGCCDCCGLSLNAPERICEQAHGCSLEGRAL